MYKLHTNDHLRAPLLTYSINTSFQRKPAKRAADFVQNIRVFIVESHIRTYGLQELVITSGRSGDDSQSGAMGELDGMVAPSRKR